MKLWSVTVPIAGHAVIEVEAESEERAIEIALSSLSMDNIEWDAICDGAEASPVKEGGKP